MKFARRVESISVSAIKQMPLFARAVPGAVSLGQGIPSFPTPSYIRKEVIRLLDTEPAIGKYSLQPGLPELKHALSRTLERRAGRPISAEQEIFISAGTMEALFTALASIVDEGDEVILFDPSYASHIEQVVFAGGRPVFVPLDEDAGWRPSLDALEKSVTSRTKAIVVCNPGNPTGTVFSKEDLALIAHVACVHGLFVVADETYDFLVYDGDSFTSLLAFRELKDQLILCNGFSKQFAMTGWRVGYMCAPQKVIEQALKIHDAAVICAPAISQYAALAALTGERTTEDEDIRSVLAERRELVCSRLDRLSDLFSYLRPSGAYYFFPRYLKTGLSSTDFAMRLLYEAKVITIPGSAFGPSGEKHIRLSYGGTEAEINEAFDRIERWNQTLA